MLQAELRVVDGKHQGKSIPLAVKQFLVGREADCHLRPSSDLVSRHHCVFLVDDFTVRLRDLGSTNGTFVNGERLQGQRVLNPGDQVQIGKLAFQVVIRQLAPVAAGVAVPYSEPAPVPVAPALDAETVDNALDSQDTGEIPSGDKTMVLDGSTVYMPPIAQPIAMAPPAPAGRPPVSKVPEVRLPDPETTGAKEVQIGSGGSPVAADPAKPVAASPSTAAADIIKNRMLRRPKT